MMDKLKKMEKIKILISSVISSEKRYITLNEKLNNIELTVAQKRKIISDMNYIKYDQEINNHEIHCYMVELGYADIREYGEKILKIDGFHDRKYYFRKPGE